ncbi:HpcH/HpaI aldolase/citrate lyase family protein [Prauserella oleivorans]|uniref:HpcH/HpaI aldolase/citrate lyase family protein n=1 Tax=Prauserella oleivorans TaxID=1478153 RepID=A0ABW5W7V6_9PSEU
MTLPLEAVRSLLFAPGKDELKLAKALDSAADLVVADLEDAVPPAEKEAARDTIAKVFARQRGRALRFVRINAPGTEWAEADLAALAEIAPDGLMVPKATPSALTALGDEGLPVIALVETAAGVRDAYETAAHPRVAALMLGGADLAAEANLEVRADGQELLHARSTLVFASVAAGIRPPFDVVHLDVHDDAALEAEARLARSLGFGGKACVHPAQLAGVHRVFTPTEAETEHANAVLAAFDDAARRGESVVLLDGKLVDPPIVNRARATLARAAR